MTSGSERRQRQCRLTIRFSEQEYASLSRAASACGLAASSYARALLIGAKPLPSARRPVIEKELLAQVLGRLGGIGTSLNQIASVMSHNTARAHSVIARLAPEITAALGDLAGSRDALLEALARGAQPS
jgi:hypothetical protein